MRNALTRTTSEGVSALAADPHDTPAPVFSTPSMATPSTNDDKENGTPLPVISVTPPVGPKMVSGYGQFHTNDPDPNKLDKKLTPYASIDLAGIRALVDTPQCVDKAKAQWLIPSTLQSRTFAAQEASGEYWMLWADLDTDPKPISEVAVILRDLIPGYDFELYASRSAREDYQKARILIPLIKPLSGGDWMLCQSVLSDKLVGADIIPDNAAHRAGQLCYLPNQGAFYDSQSVRDGKHLDPLKAWSIPIAEGRQAIAQASQKLQQDAKAAAQRREALQITDSPNLIGAFNRAYTVQEILQRAGYAQHGDTFRHPDSESGSYSASVKNGRVHSLSSSDRLYTGGGGVGAHDAFSAFTVLWADGDGERALKLAGDEWLSIDGESWNKVQQRRYAQEQAESERSSNSVPTDDHGDKATEGDAVGADDSANCLDKFALNGSAAEMRAKMLEDKFVVGRLAILGQVTFWYAPPNCGKTLLILWLLIDGIQRGEINPEDIYHINADDNHKGLTFKTELGEKYGFKVLAPGYNDFKPELLSSYLTGLIKAGKATGKVVILDTVKKFADIMDKKQGTKFGEAVRQFSMHGGTIIGLAHVNKHRDDDGKVVYSGTTDLVDDCDCAYTIDVVTSEESSKLRTVKFTNIKNRGDVALNASYRYDYSEGLSYQGRLDSVAALSDEERVAAEKRKALEALDERNQDAVTAIKEAIRSGVNKKTELIKTAVESSGLSKKAIVRALKDHTGKSFVNSHYWQVAIEEDNAHVYKLNAFC
jgi:hypothetical protein